MVFVEALKAAGAQPTRAGLVTALEGLNTDVGGFKVKFSPSIHQGSSTVYVTKVQGGKAVSVDKLQ